MSKSSYLLLNREEKVRKMSKTIVFIMIILFFVSCTKDKSIEPQDSNWCGTVTSGDTLTHKYIFKLQVNGLSSPDSIDFISSKSYRKKIIQIIVAILKAFFKPLPAAIL